MTNKISKTDQEWRAMLDPLQYQVTRHAATERAFTGRFWDHHEHGIYTCVCCDTPLFESDAKFDSGCGWPSYFKALNPGKRARNQHDRTHGMIAHRSDLQCVRCPSRPRFPRRPAAHRAALLHQLGLTDVFPYQSRITIYEVIVRRISRSSVLFRFLVGRWPP